jgi:hypothetical protein
MNKLIENQRIKFTTVIAAAVLLFGLVAADTTWKVNVSRDLQEIRDTQALHGWYRSDMARWIRDTERLNHVAGWRGADVNTEY